MRPGGEVTNGEPIDMEAPLQLDETGYLFDVLGLLVRLVQGTIGVAVS